MTAAEKITKARAALVQSQPFFASLALKLALVEDATIKTMETDGVSLFYSPEWVDALPMPQAIGVVAHEVMHPACSHHTRRGARDPKLWNMAADYAINPLLLESGFELPPGLLVDQRFAGMGADEIYRILEGEQPPEEPGGGGAGPGSSDPGGCGGVRDAPAGPGNEVPSPADITAAEQEWIISVTQAAQAAKAQGNLPPHLQRLAEAARKPASDWRELLRRFVKATTAEDFTWTPPNRRYISAGLYLPSLRSEKLGAVAVVIDTSGSIDQEALALFADELTSILEEARPSAVHVIYCGNTVDRVDTVTPDELPLRLEAAGGGGTDFRPPFDWLDDQGIEPACLVYLTDLVCFRFPPEPSFPVLWASTKRDRAPFGEIVALRPVS
jgi:predicted metal-dependent peptidase